MAGETPRQEELPPKEEENPFPIPKDEGTARKDLYEVKQAPEDENPKEDKEK